MKSSESLTLRSEKADRLFDTAFAEAINYQEANTGMSTKQNSERGIDGKPRQISVVEVPAEGAVRGSERSQRPEKVKDKMLRVNQELTPRRQEPEISTRSSTRRVSGPETRRTRHSSPPINVPQLEDTWTAKNPDWKSKWQNSLVYPATGRNRATVDAEDIPRLDEDEFLNDNIISFYVRWLQVQIEKTQPQILKKVYIFNSFFFETLKSSKTKYEGVRGWTAKVDLFSYDYIVVPVNENFHWYLAIICNASRILQKPEEQVGKTQHEDPVVIDGQGSASPKMPAADGDATSNAAPANATPLEGLNAAASGSSPRVKRRKSSGGVSIQTYDTNEPRIVTLDSLGSTHSPTCKILKEYLAEEARDKKGVELEHLPAGMKGKNIPEQDNFCDCGVFVLGYMKEFLQDPDEACRRLLKKEPLDWEIRPVEMRKEIRDILFDLQKQQQMRLDEEKEAKRQRLRAKKQAAAAAVLESALLEEVTPSASGNSTPRTPLNNSRADSPPKKIPNMGSSTANGGTSSPAAKLPVSGLSIGHEEPKTSELPEPNFVKHLNEGAGTMDDGEQNGEAYFSAASSTAHDQLDPKPESIAKPKFVQQISSSDSESMTPRAKQPKRSQIATPSDEKGPPKMKDLRNSPSSRFKRTSTTSSYFQIKDAN